MNKYGINITSNGLFIFLVDLLIVGQVFYYFTKLTHIPTFWPSVIGILVFSVVFQPAVFIKTSTISTLVLYVILLIYDYTGFLINIPQVVLEPFGIFSMVFPFFLIAIVTENLVVIANRDPGVLRKIGLFSLVAIFAAIIVNIFSEFMFPGITRTNHMHLNYPDWVASVSFGTFYTIPFIIITLLIYFKKSNIILIALMLLIIVLTILAGFITALTLNIFAFLIGLLYRFQVKQKLMVLFAVFLLMALILSNLDFVTSELSHLPNPMYKEKSEEISNLKNMSNSEDLLSNFRYGVYDISINTLKENPLFGSGNYDLIGQHSYWLDKLGFMGIVGFISYLFIFFSMFFISRALLPINAYENYNLIIILVAVFLIINPIYWPDFWLVIFVMIPCIIQYLASDFKANNTKI